jgi:surface carbohydrate biosynthesis protein (TIGR04326 family)
MYLAVENQARGTEGEKRLLLVTSFFADETDAHLAVLAQAAKDGILEGMRVCIKPHPYLPVGERLARLFPQGGAPEIVDRPVGELLVPGTLVWASNSTTAALEAALRGLFVMVQAAENDFDLCPLQGVPGLVRIRTGTDLARALASVSCPALPREYLALAPALPRWRALLDL